MSICSQMQLPSSSSEEHEGRSSSSEEREGLCSSTEEHEELLINNPKTQPDPKPRKPTQRKKNKKTRRGRKRPKIRQKRDVKPPMDTGLAETKLVTWIMSERKLSERSSYTKNYSVMTKPTVFRRGLSWLLPMCYFSMVLPMVSYAQSAPPHILILSQDSTHAALQCTRASTPEGCHTIDWTVNGEAVNGRPGFQISTRDCWSHLTILVDSLSNHPSEFVVKCTVETLTGVIEDSDPINISLSLEATGTPSIPTIGTPPTTSSDNDVVTGSELGDTEESEGIENTTSSAMMNATKSGSNPVVLKTVISATTTVLVSILAVSSMVVVVVVIHYRNNVRSIVRSCSRSATNGGTYEVAHEESQNLETVIAHPEKWEDDENREEREKFSVPKSNSNETVADLSGHNEQQFQPRDPSHRANRRDILDQQQVATSKDTLQSAIDIPEREEAKSNGHCEMIEGDDIEFHHRVSSGDDTLSFSALTQPEASQLTPSQ